MGSLVMNPSNFLNVGLTNFVKNVNGKIPPECLTLDPGQEKTPVLVSKMLVNVLGIHHSNTCLQIHTTCPLMNIES
jgi:hypothetical protein